MLSVCRRMCHLLLNSRRQGLEFRVTDPPKHEPCCMQENVSSGTKFKEGRELERKAQAGNRAAWNSLFMRPDTVAEAIAAHYGISKAQLLSREAADLPVRMALGEAHVVALTKKALGDAGKGSTSGCKVDWQHVIHPVLSSDCRGNVC